MFDKKFQKELLRHCLKSAAVMDAAGIVVRPSDFGVNVCAVVWEAMMDYRKVSGVAVAGSSHALSLSVLKVVANEGGEFKTAVDEAEFAALSTLMEYMDNSEPLTPEWFLASLPGFIMSSRGRKVLSDASDSPTSNGGLEAVHAKLSQVIDEAQAQTRNTFTSPTSKPLMITADSGFDRITTGLTSLDGFMDGGLQRGDLGMVVATPGVGKTTTLLHFTNMAAYAGHRCLFLTLELQDHKIHWRYLAMASGIELDWFKRLTTSWPDEQLKRLAAVCDDKYPIHDRVTVSDESPAPPNTLQIDARIKLWRKMTIEKYGDDRECALVCVDWLNLIPAIPGEVKRDKDDILITKVAEQLKRVAIKHNVAIWTAQQGNRQADGKKFVRMSHTAGAYQSNAPMDVAIGAGRAAGGEDEEDYQPQQRKDDFLNFNITKNRHGGVGSCVVYRAPTMRLFDSREEYDGYQRASKAKLANLAAMYAINSESARAKVKSELEQPNEFNYAGSPRAVA
jgi:replicative DNA helicase